MAAMVSVGEALDTILAAVTVLPAEVVPLAQSRGRILAAAVTSPLNLPTFDNSAMDGFVLLAADTVTASPETPVRLAIRGEIPAGATGSFTVASGQALRIMTGARLPAGGDAIVPLEETTVDGDQLVVTRPVSPGAHARRAGEDLTAGEAVFTAGTVLTPPRVALLAAMGLDKVTVHRRPQVTVLTTGDELVEPGTPLQPGQIYNSNAYALMAAIEEAGGEAVRVALVADDAEITRERLQAALGGDAVVSSGGVSVGDYDFVGRTLQTLGTVHFAKVAQQPGKPFTFATVAGVPFFALPGNPAATMVAMEVYVRPALRRMMGDPAPQRPGVTVRLAEAVTAKPGRTQWLRARAEPTAQGLTASLTGPQGSGLIRAMAWANCLLQIPPGSATLAAGSPVSALLLDAAEAVNERPRQAAGPGGDDG
jgi:molybdopterin molybdotransferase